MRCDRPAGKNGEEAALCAWMDRRLRTAHAGKDAAAYGHGREDVTALAYHFWEEDRFDRAFSLLECAVRETWLRCGMMKTALVVNRSSPRLERFAEAFSPWVKVQVEPSLVPGRLYTMSVDCNSRLHTRFDTPSVLVIQNDGFPLRPGLDAFVGKYDFIGAPYVRDIWWKRAVCAVLGCWVSSGGFSLRSREICERAAFYWAKKKYRTLPDCRAVSEDLFYTQTLPIRERAYRRSVRIADCRAALSFSYDAIVPYTRPTLPFGFHGAKSFVVLSEQFALDG